MVNLHEVCDYIILRLSAGDVRLNLLKLQKLMYYVQAWHLAFYQKPLFASKFQAWVHGPVSRILYDRFVTTKSLYSFVGKGDVLPETNPYVMLPPSTRLHIDSVLELYAKYSDTQLEEMTHREDPWLKAREGLAESQRCEREIDETTMATYYAARIASTDNLI